MSSSVIVTLPGNRPPYEVRLEAGTVRVGRAETNEIALRDMNVSRHHFTIERQQSHYVLRDNNSRNGTVVNDVAIMNKILVEGDRIKVGGSVLTFRAVASPQALDLADAPRPSRQSGQMINPVPQAARVTVKRRDPETRHRSERLRAMATDQGQVERPDQTTPVGDDAVSDERWRKLAEVACAINLEHDLEKLLETILEAVLALVPSNSACLVLREGDELRVTANYNAPDAGIVEDGQSSEGYRLSRQVCLEAISQRRPVLTQDAVGDEKLGQFMSVLNLRLKSILCVPFASQDDVLGVVYLDEPKQDLFADDGELVALVGAFGDLAGIALANARLLNEIASRERLEEELRIAARIQQGLLPGDPPACQGLEIAGKTRAARSVGGDTYDFFRREQPADEVLIGIGDVAGKGVGAGLVVSTVRSLLRAYAESLLETDAILGRVNAHLHQDLTAGLFVSYLLLRYSEDDGQVAFTGAGHEHLILYRPSTGQLEFMRAGGVVLGLVSDLGSRLSERRMTLYPGDVVVLYTDGATEARRPGTTEEFGLDRIGEAIRRAPPDATSIVEQVMQEVIAFGGGEQAELHDDLTVVALRKT